MLDKRHPNLAKPPNDPNAYTLGSIGSHNIVIACLPKGRIGTSSATAVATYMVNAFPAIRFGLMVGIGGGVPPKVRLGDVVVSVPAGQLPGVVQWDMGKAELGGQFKRTGALSNQPTLLLTALAQMETRHELEGSKMPEYLEAPGEKYPRLVAKYLRTDRLEDVLFKVSYGHVSKTEKDPGAKQGDRYGEEEEKEENGELDEDKEDSCQFCDKGQTVKRKQRETRVHYGTIASGNQVIKDAAFRDRLSKGLGGVLCVEMEAAGLLDNYPCIVIRGICDYADSHKNKEWQEHAAATAAAFAKELLEYVEPYDVAAERRVRDVLPRLDQS